MELELNRWLPYSDHLHMFDCICHSFFAGGPNFVIDETRFSPGLHLLDITITTLFGQTLIVVPSIVFFIEG